MTVVVLLILAVLLILSVQAARRKRLRLLVLYILLILPCAMLFYFSVYYRAGKEARRALPDREAVPISFAASARFFDGPGEDTALIFYPGAKVEAAAYAPLLSKIAAGGVDCFLVEMPLHFAFLGVNAADQIIENPALRPLDPCRPFPRRRCGFKLCSRAHRRRRGNRAAGVLPGG